MYKHEFLTLLSRMEFPNIINWIIPFPFKGILGCTLHFIQILI